MHKNAHLKYEVDATNMGVNATGTLGGGRRSSAEDARIEAP